MGMIMHDDVPYGEGTSYTQGTGIAINNNIIAVDADNTPTENSEKPVKSKGVYSALESNSAESTSLLKSTVGWVGKNLLEIPTSVVSGTKNNVVYTVTRNSDGQVTEINANGLSNAGGAFVLIDKQAILSAGRYILSGCAQSNDYTLYVNAMNGSSFVRQLATTSTGIIEFDVDYVGYDCLSIGIYADNNKQLSNVKFYPMLRDASITDDTYEPYHESVEEEIEQIYADNGVLGAKNLLPNNFKSRTVNGVSFITNADGSITANGTSTQDWTTIEVASFKLPKGKYVFSGVTDGAQNTFRMSLNFTMQSSLNITLYDGESEFELTQDDIATAFINVRYADVTLTDINFHPMLRLASDPDDTYVPYAMTNRELTEDKLSISELKTIASSAADFAAFKTAIANL